MLDPRLPVRSSGLIPVLEAPGLDLVSTKIVQKSDRGVWKLVKTGTDL